jgi:hypothetical protein
MVEACGKTEGRRWRIGNVRVEDERVKGAGERMRDA